MHNFILIRKKMLAFEKNVQFAFAKCTILFSFAKKCCHSKKCPIRIRKMHNFILIRKEMFGIGKNVQLAFAKCNLHDFSKRTSQLSSQILLTRQ